MNSSYWKKRCMLAELLLHQYRTKGNCNQTDLEKWLSSVKDGVINLRGRIFPIEIHKKAILLSKKTGVYLDDPKRLEDFIYKTCELLIKK